MEATMMAAGDALPDTQAIGENRAEITAEWQE
jgi:hypothetical protein